MKKVTAYIFILLSSIVLLAHAAVPHHHHKTQVCIENSHCENDNKPHQHDASSHDHEHDGETGADFCILKQLVILPTNHNEQEFNYVPIADGHSSHDGFNFVIPNNDFKPYISAEATELEVPLIIPNYSLLATTSIGLRGPPAV
jgi:hypothetical protein